VTHWGRFGLPTPRALTPRQRLDAPQAMLQQFLVELGAALVGAGVGVTDVAGTLRQAAIAMGAPDAQLIVFPTALMVSVPGIPGRHHEQEIALQTSAAQTVRFDQLTALFALTDKARAAEITPIDGLAELDAIAQLRPRFRYRWRVLGHGIAAAGVCMLLKPTWTDVGIACVLGIVAGVWVLVSAKMTVGRVLAPVIAAFGIGLIVFTLAKHGIGDAPLKQLVPPLISYIPGSVVTLAIGELAAGDMIAGSSRLVYGFFMFAQLALGIVGAALVIGIDTAAALRVDAVLIFGDFTPWVGVLLLGAGYFLLNCGGRGSFGWLLFVLLVAYSGQVLGGSFLDGLLSGLVGAFLMTLTAYVIQAVPTAPPAVVLFLPGFWLLIPGAAGLIGLTQLVGTHASTVSSLLNVGATMLSVSAGVLAGAGAYRTLFRYAPISWGLRRA
jgi:uncharacterized membrane protein YjjP (DUF1212 family)